jgi:tetratricopeptide (TPR) repeat protein
MKRTFMMRALACLAVLFLLSTGYAWAEDKKELDPKYRELVQTALASLKSGDTPKALELLNSAIAIDSKFFVAYAAKASILLGDKKYAEAITALDTAIVNNPDEANLYMMRSDAYIKNNEKDKAIADLKKARELCVSTKDIGGETIIDVKLERLTTEPPKDATITWRKDIAPLLDGKEKTTKLLLVDVYTDWCGWCKVMDQKTYTDPYVAKFLNENFVCIKLNAEDKGEGTTLAAAMKVDGFPCTCILDVTKKANTNISGFAEPDAFLAKLRLAIRALKED